MTDQYWFDEAAADAACQFVERHCVLTEDQWAGKPFRLEPWQRDDILRPLFGWKREDGLRRYRRCIVWVPRKNGKTELAAAIALLGLVATGITGGQVYSIASHKDQAKLVFDKAGRMVAWSPSLAKVCESFKTSIYCSQLSSAFKPLSGKPAGKHGFSSTCLIGDEVHEWPDDRLYTFVHQSSANRAEPIEFLISTAGTRKGFGWELWQHCEKVRAGIIDDPETLIVVYAADQNDDWTSPETWAKANPNLGISVRRDYLAAECQRAQENPRLENDFKRYHLGIWTEQAERWLQLERWQACVEGDDPDAWRDLPERMIGRKCFGGLDLSSTTDTTSLCWLFPPEEPGDRWVGIWRHWIPADNMAARVRRDRVPYDNWASAGALQTTPGNVIDYAHVREAILEDATRYEVQMLGVDPYNATQLTIELIADGLPVFKFRQGYLSMSPAAKQFDKLVMAGDLDHGSNPVVEWMAQNVAISHDAHDNIKPDKVESTERIDGIVAAVMAAGLATATEIPAPSVYEERGILMV